MRYSNVILRGYIWRSVMTREFTNLCRISEATARQCTWWRVSEFVRQTSRTRRSTKLSHSPLYRILSRERGLYFAYFDADRKDRACLRPLEHGWDIFGRPVAAEMTWVSARRQVRVRHLARNYFVLSRTKSVDN